MIDKYKPLFYKPGISWPLGGEEEEVVSVAFTDSGEQGTPGTTLTVSGLGFGTPSSSRKIAACITWEDSNNVTLNSVTIGGETASRAVRATGSDQQNAEIWIASVPNGASGSVAATFSASCDRMAVSTYRLTGIISDTPYDTATDTLHASMVMDVSLNTPTGESVIIVCFHNGDAVSSPITPSGYTEGADFTYDSTAANHASGSHLSTGEETPRTLTGTYGSNPFQEMACAAVFQ